MSTATKNGPIPVEEDWQRIVILDEWDATHSAAMVDLHAALFTGGKAGESNGKVGQRILRVFKTHKEFFNRL